jgi:hypothetical protein
VTFPQKEDAIHSMILDDGRIYTENIAEAISQERVSCNIREVAVLRKLSAKWF